ncbi:Tetratricopeptide repeat-containing protein [Nitrosospira multiformis]|uniref:Tetratricopeptide repeat-containing protein n=1 Tax=Nitrosospira multiformis TaxID=1231 RepID=A0A1I0FSR7_9PROT|nr:toll/interleukin-1 receptor domain-containing protein [Nitrosospira multiformis]SET60600.1 Tetratricopeptide repeat-containing protein [Nitrosospira multiformis]
MNYQYHAFISHNSADKPAVESIAAALVAQGLHCFLDKWDILPRDQWLRNLENGLTESQTILIFIGTQGVGPYQQAEADAALRRQIQQRQDCVIPVLLPGASPEDLAKLSIFLQGTNALRFHDLKDPLPFRILAALVRGEEPGNLRQLLREQVHPSVDLLQTLNDWLSGLHIEWREKEEEYQIREGQGKSCLCIPDLSASPNPDSIEYLLNWKSRLTPLFGREQELKVLHDWADAHGRISIRMVIGEAGVGKTRLAFEFGTRLREKGWQAGEAQGLEGRWYTGRSGTLLIIDYPEHRPEKVTALLEAFAVMPPPQRKLRVLLLGRNGDFLRKLPQTAQSLVAPHIALSSLAMDESAAWCLFQQSWQRIHQLRHVSPPSLPMSAEGFKEWGCQAELRSRPLFILALTIRLMLDPSARELNGNVIIRVLTQQYEVSRLRKEAKKRNIDENSLVMLRALAVIPGQLEGQVLRQLIEESTRLKLDIQLPALRQLIDTSLWVQGAIPALQPDLLAADLLHYALTELAEDQSGQWQYVGLEAAVDIAEASSIFGRLIHDAQNVLGQRWPLSSLIDWVCEERMRCERLSFALNRNYLERTLLPLAIAVERVLLVHADLPQTQALHLRSLSLRLGETGEREASLRASQRAVAIYEQLAADNFSAYGPDLASSLSSLSISLAEIGEREAGLQIIRRAVTIHEQLAQENFAVYGSGLAMSLNNLSNHLAGSGARKESLQAIQAAAEIHERLAKENLAAFGPDLATSLHNLSNRLANNGESGAALDACLRAVEIREQLAQDNFAAHGYGLGTSLHSLANHLRGSGKHSAALQAIQQAVAIYEQLAKENFAAYGSDWAGGLTNLSVHLANNGEHSAALQAIQRAVAIYERLAQENSAVHRPALALSLNNLSNRLAESGEHGAALQAIQRAIAIREQLAQENFAAYGSDLAMSLINLCTDLSNSGEWNAALQACLRAVEIYEQLAADNFAAYAPDLAGSLHILSIRLAESGERKRATHACLRGVEIYEQLAADNFAAHGPALAGALNILSSRLAESGEQKAGLHVCLRAVEIYEQLAADNFATYGPQLTGGLNNLASRLAESGQRDTALQISRRAVAIVEKLAADNFAVYGSVLAMNLHNLSLRLADNGEHDEGLKANLRVVEIYERLATGHFPTYGAELASSLNNLSNRLVEKGELGPALQASLRAVEIYEQLVKKNFAVHGPNLGVSLNNLSANLRSSGDQCGALRVIHHAVEIYEKLAGDNFAAHGPVLAVSLYNLAVYLDALDTSQAAETRAKLQIIKQRILNEQVQVPAWLAPLFE